jgi:hypothetical protein
MAITKGKWYVSGGDKYATIQSKNIDEKIVVTYPTIATVNSTFIDVEEFRANAKLIADAPNLLSVLNQIINNPTPYNERELQSWYETARNLALDAVAQHSR